jgi:hypothetical protein
MPLKPIKPTSMATVRRVTRTIAPGTPRRLLDDLVLVGVDLLTLPPAASLPLRPERVNGAAR